MSLDGASGKEPACQRRRHKRCGFVWYLDGKDPMEEGMAAHSSILAWKIPWTEEPVKLQSIGSQRVGHHWATSLSLSFWDFNRTEKDMISNDIISRSGSQKLQFNGGKNISVPSVNFWLIWKMYKIIPLFLPCPFWVLYGCKIMWIM